MLQVAGPRPGLLGTEQIDALEVKNMKFEYKPIGSTYTNTFNSNTADQANVKPFTPGRAVSPGSGQNFGMLKPPTQIKNEDPYGKLKLSIKNIEL